LTIAFPDWFTVNDGAFRLQDHITSAMSTGDALMTLLVTLAMTSSVTWSVGLYHAPDDVSRLLAADAGAVGDADGVMARRTPGWGKRRDRDWLMTDKRRGWGKRDADADADDCAYWRSLLQFVEVSIDRIFTVAHKYQPSSKDQAHHTTPTPQPQCGDSITPRNKVVWCGCGVWTKVGTCLFCHFIDS